MFLLDWSYRQHLALVGGDEDCKKAACHAASCHPFAVDMAAAVRLQKSGGAPIIMKPQPQQHIIMPVKEADRHHRPSRF